MNRGLPWIDHLHSALKLLDGNKPDTNEAYTEICRAIMKSGGSLTGTEKNSFFISIMTIIKHYKGVGKSVFWK